MASTFTAFQFETTISAIDMNNNFEYVGSGNWLPHGGPNLDNTNGIYDLGAQNERWKDVYCNDLHVTGRNSSNCWNVMSEITLSTSATSIEFQLSSEYENFTLIFDAVMYANATLGNMGYITFNNDSSASYGYLSTVFWPMAAPLVSTYTSQQRLGIYDSNGPGNTGTVYNVYVRGEAYINARAGAAKLVISNIETDIDAGFPVLNVFSGIHNNTDTVTSIKITLSRYAFNSGSKIRLMGAD
ncbi:MAG: hypothetical protein WC374_07550 [Phycisphaerae bacterium]|jgi:hypothetical protein